MSKSPKEIYDFQNIKVEPSTHQQFQTSNAYSFIIELLIHEIKEEGFEKNEATPIQDLTEVSIKQEEFGASKYQNKQENEMIEISASASIKSSLKKHVNFVHEGKRLFKCEICNGRFTEKIKLKQHIEDVHCLTTISIVHEGNKSFQCELCVFTTQKNCDLRKHKSEVHEEEKPHQCGICNLSFARKWNLDKHVVSVHKNSSQI